MVGTVDDRIYETYCGDVEAQQVSCILSFPYHYIPTLTYFSGLHVE